MSYSPCLVNRRRLYRQLHLSTWNSSTVTQDRTNFDRMRCIRRRRPSKRPGLRPQRHMGIPEALALGFALLASLVTLISRTHLVHVIVSAIVDIATVFGRRVLVAHAVRSWIARRSRACILLPLLGGGRVTYVASRRGSAVRKLWMKYELPYSQVSRNIAYSASCGTTISRFQSYHSQSGRNNTPTWPSPGPRRYSPRPSFVGPRSLYLSRRFWISHLQRHQRLSRRALLPDRKPMLAPSGSSQLDVGQGNEPSRPA